MKKLCCANSSKEISDTVQTLDQFFLEVNAAFTQHRLTLKYRQANDDLPRQIRKGLVSLYEGCANAAAGEALAAQSTASNLSKIFYNLLRISAQVETKVKENILFSDAASGEMSSLAKRTRELLRHVGDAVTTQNELILDHVQKETADLFALVESMSAAHEDRLCKGVCHPKASIVYMNLLQHLADILWHYQALLSEGNGLPAV